jgi:hypothetical protein
MAVVPTPPQTVSFRRFAAARARYMIASNSILDSPEHWLERAEKARSIAEQLSDAESRRMMLRIVEDY